MRVRWPVRRVSMVLTAMLVTATLLSGLGPGTASAATCKGWLVTKPPNPGTDNQLRGVAVVSSRRVWAVGEYGDKQLGEQTVIAGWNGATWTRASSPNPAPSNQFNALYGVAAISPASAWAVGTYGLSTGAVSKSLIARWNGTAWKRASSPNPGSMTNVLQGVAAVSSTNIWAVGDYSSGADGNTLVEHWNGKRWRHVPSPNADSFNVLNGVAASSATNAWAVGYSNSGFGYERTLTEHWNGTRWTRVPSPNPATGSNNNFLTGVAVISSKDAWAVGDYTNLAAEQTLIEHWNGKRWRQVSSPNPDSFFSVLNGVAAVSATNIWAVGVYGAGTLILRWNGFAWLQVASPSPGAASFLNAAAATSSTKLWAVGWYRNRAGFTGNLALHRC